MTDYEYNIAYYEGMGAFDDTSLVDNPYDGVSDILCHAWSEGWWASFYGYNTHD